MFGGSLVRSSLLLMYDDANREHLEMKIMNFGFSQAIPDEDPPLTHTAPWDGTPESHEDGYLVGVRELARMVKRAADEIDGASLTVQHV